MPQPLANTAPAIQSISVEDETHARQMAEYVTNLAKYNESPFRRHRQKLNCISGTAGTLGVAIVGPVTCATLASPLVSYITYGVSSLCCIAWGVGLTSASPPSNPSKYRRNSTSGRTGEGGGGAGGDDGGE